jgi:phage gpG-like protein
MSNKFINNGSEFINWLKSKQIRGSNQLILTNKIGSDIVKQINKDFEASQSSEGKRWAALKWRDGDPLMDTLNLKNSMSFKFVSGVIYIGTNVKYASVHQYGRDAMTVYPKSKLALYFNGASHPFKKANVGAIPARPFLPITANIPLSWQKIIKDDVYNYLRGLNE